MIFPSETVENARRDLAESLADSTLDPEAAFTRLLAVDPFNRVALFELSRLRQAAGDLTAAEQYCRRGLSAHACDYRFYVQLSGMLAEQQRDLPLAAGLMELGVLKLLTDADSIDDAERLRKMGKFPGAAAEFTDPAALRAFADDLALQREHEPPAVSDELRPYRLIHELQECFGNQLDRDLVDGILRLGESCRPLLLGVLRGFAEDYLPEGGDFMSEAALALLGEIADPASLPALVQFAVVDDKALSDIGSWALLRTATLKPAETVSELARFDRAWGGAERACMAETLATMPASPGKPDALFALLENFGRVREAERSDTFVVIAAGLLSVLGKGAPPAIRRAFEENARVLPLEARSSIDDLLKAYAADPSLFAIADEEAVPSVYDICCSDRLAAYEQDDEEGNADNEEHVHGPDCRHEHEHAATGMPGRNDPCWCGSGRKYKKCHLPQDEESRLGNLPEA